MLNKLRKEINHTSGCGFELVKARPPVFSEEAINRIASFLSLVHGMLSDPRSECR